MRVFLVGSSKVPYDNSASDIRLKSYAELFCLCGYEVTIVNRYATLCDAFKNQEDYTDSPYKIKELLKPRTKGFLFPVLFVWSVVAEFFYLLKDRIKNDSDGVLHLYTGHFVDLLFYKFVSLLTGYKIIYQYVEYRSAIQRNGLYHRFNGKLFDAYGPKLWHGVIPISHFLKEKALEVNPKLAWMVGPPICDYSQFDAQSQEKERIVLFCGSAGYFDVVKLIVDSFNQSRISKAYKLVLILSGSNEQLGAVKEYAPNAEIKTRLPYLELIENYNKASVLMIPLRNTIQDIARFPNKVCEYAASKGVIVSTVYGEPAYFFKDKVSALIADDFSVDALTEKLDWLYDNENEIECIGQRGYEIGTEVFNLNSYQTKIQEFLAKI